MQQRTNSFHQAKQASEACAFASDACLYYFQIHLRHLLAPFPFWRPLIPLSVALLRCVSFTLARMKNSRRILAHFHLEIVLHVSLRCIYAAHG